MSAEVIVGRYELGDRLGAGGMSTVVLAFDRRLERYVAVKLLAEHLADDTQFVSRFRREALAAARLVHPNIVQVFDFGLDDTTGRHYIVMEYIRGQSGAQILRDEGKLSVRDALHLVDGSCRGLHYAHRNGVVHRDVKPGNLLRSEEGQVKLADFGIAKATDGSAITQAGSVLGTAAYLAPEQAHGEVATARSDLYGLGVVTYQLLAGRLPYEATSLTELALAQQREHPPRLDEVNPLVPPALADAVDRALELEPEERYPDAEQMRRALEAAGRDDGDATTRVVRRDRTAATRAIPQSPSQRRTEPRAPRQPRPAPPGPARQETYAEPARRKNRGWLLVVLAVVVAGIAAAAIALSASNGGREVTTRDIDGQNLETVVQQMNSLINENIR
jgi:eukaryotic-like serine/threonine-protein kinase